MFLFTKIQNPDMSCFIHGRGSYGELQRLYYTVVSCCFYKWNLRHSGRECWYMACACFSKVNFETFMWDHPTLMFGTDCKCQPHHHELSFVPMFDSFRKCIPTRHASHGLLWWLVQRPQFNKFLQEKKSSLWWIISEADWAASESLQ